MDNLVYQIPHKIMQDLVNHIGNNFTWIQAEPVLKLIRDNIKEINLGDKPAKVLNQNEIDSLLRFDDEAIPAVEGK